MYMNIILITFVSIIYTLALVSTRKFNRLTKTSRLTLLTQGIILFLIVKFGIYGISKIGGLQFWFFSAQIETGSFQDMIQYIKEHTSGLTKIALLAIIPAVIEEGSKGLSLMIHNRATKNLRSSSDIIWGIIYISLGFSFGETIWYILHTNDTQIYNNSQIYIYGFVRSILLGCGHLFFSLIIGICYAQSRFWILKRIDLKKRNKWKYLVERYTYPLFWILLATILHAVFNISIQDNDPIYAILLIYGGMYIFTLWIQHIPFLFRKYNPLLRKIELLKFIKKKKKEIQSIEKE